jgi:hypothetical protein
VGSRPSNHYFFSIMYMNECINYDTSFKMIYSSCKNVSCYITGAQETNLTWPYKFVSVVLNFVNNILITIDALLYKQKCSTCKEIMEYTRNI